MVQSPACDIAPQVTGDGGTMTGAGTQTAQDRGAPRPRRAAGALTAELRLQETQITKCGCNASFQTGS